MRNTNMKIYIQNSNYGLDIYLDISGKLHYLATHRHNGLLYIWLKNGKTLGEIIRLKPSRSRREQKIYHYSRYIRKLIEIYFNAGLE